MKSKFMTMYAAMALLALGAIVQADSFGTGANQFTIDFVPVSGSTNPASGYGIVNNDYRMGKLEVTNNQWNKFAASLGVPVTGSPAAAYDASSMYSGTNLPVNCVSWYEAAQFVNWLNTSTGRQAAYKFTGTQGAGDYSFTPWAATDPGYDASNPYRNSNAFYFLPTENEWVKAAYWNGASIQTYATKAGESLIQGNGTNGVGWNYQFNGVYAYYNPWAAGSGSEELNGTHDMMGNVAEWMESPYNEGAYAADSLRGWRGGNYNTSTSPMASSGHSYHTMYNNPATEYGYDGFRVASLATAASCPSADLSGDCFVNLKDFALFAAQWLRADCVTPGWCSGADLDKSGAVGLDDGAKLAEQWLTGVKP